MRIVRGSMFHQRVLREKSVKRGVLLLSVALAPLVLSGCSGLVGSASNNPPSTLVISNVQAGSVTTSASQVVWTTNVPSTSSVDYGTTIAYGNSTPVDSTMVTNHQVTLSGLAAGTTYYYQVNSTDSKGNHGHGGNKFNTAGYSLSGTITPSAAGNGATVALSGPANASATADNSGNYTFTGLPNGTYTIVPSHAGFTFTPSSQNMAVNGANVTGVNFTATSQTFSISGTISPVAGGSGATVSLSGAANATATANASGAYTFTGLANGSYTVTPSNVGYTFTPSSQNATVGGASVTGVNFSATPQVGQTFSISGTISPTAGGSVATVTLSGGANSTTTANASGAYTFTGLASGSYTVTPSNTGYTFTPPSQNVTVNGANVTGVNFTGSAQGTFSISGTITPAAIGSGTTVTLSGAARATVTADSLGAYAFGGLANGAYTITVSYATTTSIVYTFAPTNQSVIVSGANVNGVNFAVTLYFGTEPSHATYLPRSDAFCSSAVTPNSWEPRSDNYTANNTVFAPSSFNWTTSDNSWTKWANKRAQVTGNFTGTTTEIIQWAGCKWGIDEDTIRADAVQESYWHQNTIGDVCGPVGEGSYGLMQIKNQDCSGAYIHGGYPDTHLATPLAVDWYAARIRSCYDGDFYDGGQWLYLGQTVDQIAAANGWPYVFWACIGFHFSGNWSPGQTYQLQVQQHLANRDWAQPGF